MPNCLQSLGHSSNAVPIGNNPQTGVLYDKVRRLLIPITCYTAQTVRLLITLFLCCCLETPRRRNELPMGISVAVNSVF
jgi:hypothetical protein